jgi:uncharacterized membrane protein (UPF0182 family)
MKIRTKAFLLFQFVVAFVTAIIMTIYWTVTGFIDSEPMGAFDGLFFSIVSIIAFAIILLPVWKLWGGKSWYSLSLLFLLAILITAVFLFLLSNNLNGDISFVIAWTGIIFIGMATPAYLIIACIIGLLGKYIVNRFPN